MDLPATLRASLIRGGEVGFSDLRAKQFLQRQRALVVFVIDSSESMGQGTLERMQAAKGAILGLLTAAYQNRDQVALVTFGGEQAQVLLRPTTSVLLAQQRLRRLPLGGATPFADGLWQGWQLIRNERQKQPHLKPLLVIVSDGEANLPLSPGSNVHDELKNIALQISRDRVESLVIDSCSGIGNQQLRQFARQLNGNYQQIRNLHAGRLIEVVQSHDHGG